jgi:hypothetical protein
VSLSVNPRVFQAITGCLYSAPGDLSLPRATASTVVQKPRGFSKGWFENEGPTAVASNTRALQYTPPASPGEVRCPEPPLAPKEPQVWLRLFSHPYSFFDINPQLSATLVQVKSHAQPVTKKKGRTPRNLLANIPGYLKERYVTGFQPAFIYTAITISEDPWARLPIEDVQALFSAVFPEVTHEIEFGDIFHSPVRDLRFASKLSNYIPQAKQLASMVRNHIKEAALTAIHRVMEGRLPSARQHLAAKAEKYGKEFPFIYRYHEVSDIPDRHAEGGEVVVSHSRCPS